MADQKNRAVADDFAGRRDLDDVAEREIQFRVGVRDFLPPRAESHGFGLLAKIRVLPAGHFVNVNFRRARRRRVVERAVPRAHRLPIIRAGIERIEIEPRIALGVLQRGDHGIQIGLAGRAAHRSDRGVGGVHAGFRRFQDRSGIDAAGIMRVKMNGQAHFLAQGREQPLGRVRLAQAAHVLDAQNVRAHLFQFFRQANVILQRIFVALRIENVARVADGRLANLVRLLRIVSTESFMLGSQFSASNTRKISMPCFADSRMNASTALSG